MKLVDNWRVSWRMASMQLSAVIVGLGTLETFMPELQQYLPPKVYAGLGAAVMVARIIQQAKLAVDAAKNETESQQ